jgi:hypothetical protein
MRKSGPIRRSRAAMLSVFALLVVPVVVVAFLVLAATSRDQAAYRDFAASVDVSCDELGAYQMTLDVEPSAARGPVDAAWARISALPAPSPLAPDVAQARAHLAELARNADVTSPAGADLLARACGALVGASLSHAGPARATMLPGPS